MQYNVSVRKKDKGYQVIVSYKDGYRWRQKSKQGFRTQREAKEYGHVILKELDKTALLTKDTELKDLTFKEFADMFLEIKKGHVTHNTLAMYRHAVDAYSSINNIKLSDIKPLHIQNVVNKMVSSPTTINSYYKVVSRIFYIAINPYKIISDNPCTGVRLPRVERKNTIHTISDEDLNQFAKYMREKYPQAYYFLQIARYTGMRLSEVYGLTWDDIDLKNHKISVNKQLSYIKGVKLPLRKPKPPIRCEFCQFPLY